MAPEGGFTLRRRWAALLNHLQFIPLANWKIEAFATLGRGEERRRDLTISSSVKVDGQDKCRPLRTRPSGKRDPNLRSVSQLEHPEGEKCIEGVQVWPRPHPTKPPG